MNWLDSTGGNERRRKKQRMNIIGSCCFNWSPYVFFFLDFCDKGYGPYFENFTSKSSLHCRQLMLDKFAEDDKIDQMNAQKRRMK